MQKFPLRNLLSLTIEYKKRGRLGRSETSQVLCHEENKVDFLVMKSFRFSKKRKLSILLNFPVPFLYFVSVFSFLNCKTLVLKTTAWKAHTSNFVEKVCPSLMYQICFFPQQTII